jgi:hypothetical protein
MKTMVLPTAAAFALLAGVSLAMAHGGGGGGGGGGGHEGRGASAQAAGDIGSEHRNREPRSERSFAAPGELGDNSFNGVSEGLRYPGILRRPPILAPMH